MNADKRAELEQLIDLVCEGRIGPFGFQRLNDLLLDDPNAQRLYLTRMDLINTLRWQIDGELTARSISAVDTASPPRRSSVVARLYHRHPVYAASIAAALLAFVALLAYVMMAPPLETPAPDPERHAQTPQPVDPPSVTDSPEAPAPAQRIQLANATGQVTITEDDGSPVERTESSIVLKPGQTLRTHEGDSSVHLVYEDGTSLTLAANSALTLQAADAKQYLLTAGQLSAQVAKQPEDRPFLLTTPDTRLQVLGTRFTVRVQADMTHLIVEEGAVRFTRLADMSSLDVAAGKTASAGSASLLTIHDTGAAPDVWEADFEDRQLGDWRLGVVETQDLPAGSKGALRAQMQDHPDTTFYQILSAENYQPGLFTIHDDSHIHITFKLAHREWINFFIGTRTPDLETAEWANYNYPDNWWRNVTALNTWHTATIPLRDFNRVSDVSRKPMSGQIAFSILLSCPDFDRGLVVDRIWVTRGGPGVFQIKPVE